MKRMNNSHDVSMSIAPDVGLTCKGIGAVSVTLALEIALSAALYLMVTSRFLKATPKLTPLW